MDRAKRSQLHYARWKSGEIDIVNVPADLKPSWAVEVKWSDKSFEHPATLKSVIEFCRQNDMDKVTITTRTAFGIKNFDGIVMTFVPSSIYCYTVARSVIRSPREFR